MTVFGISMMKDEVDVVEPVLRHMATQVDMLLVTDNNSTDGTRDLLSDLSVELPLQVFDDPEIGYFQSKKMTSLAQTAGNQGATFIVPFDSDEIHYSPFGTLKDVLNDVGSQWLVATADIYDHVSSSEDDLSDLNPITRIGWRRNYKGVLPKVACRWREDLTIEQGNHAAKYSGGTTFQEGLLVIRHFPYRSETQILKKVKNGAAAYAATDLPENVGAHWRGYGAIIKNSGEEVFIDEVYKRWFYLQDPHNTADVIYDPASLYIKEFS